MTPRAIASLLSLLSALATGCTSSPAPSTPAAPSASPLAACCTKLGELWRRTEMQQAEDVVRSPAEQAALQEQISLSRAAHETCDAELGAPGHSAAESLAKVKASAGKLDLATLAPACTP